MSEQKFLIGPELFQQLVNKFKIEELALSELEAYPIDVLNSEPENAIKYVKDVAYHAGRASVYLELMKDATE